MAVKKAEDSKRVVVRLLETSGTNREVTISLAPELRFRSATKTDLMERKTGELKIENNQLTIPIKRQEIVTLILEK